MRRAALAAAAGWLAAACFAGTAFVDPRYVPYEVQEIDAAGIHALRFAIRVHDRREIGDARNVGQRAGSPLYAASVRSTRDAAVIVMDALAAELRSHDLRVTSVDGSDVLIEVELSDLYAIVDAESSGLFKGGEVEGHVGGRVRVGDRRSGKVFLDGPYSGRSEVRSLLLTAQKYEWALTTALGEFARRIVRHPDFLIAVQRVGPINPPSP